MFFKNLKAFFVVVFAAFLSVPLRAPGQGSGLLAELEDLRADWKSASGVSKRALERRFFHSYGVPVQYVSVLFDVLKIGVTDAKERLDANIQDSRKRHEAAKKADHNSDTCKICKNIRALEVDSKNLKKITDHNMDEFEHWLKDAHQGLSKMRPSTKQWLEKAQDFGVDFLKIYTGAMDEAIAAGVQPRKFADMDEQGVKMPEPSRAVPVVVNKPGQKSSEPGKPLASSADLAGLGKADMSAKNRDWSSVKPERIDTDAYTKSPFMRFFKKFSQSLRGKSPVKVKGDDDSLDDEIEVLWKEFKNPPGRKGFGFGKRKKPKKKVKPSSGLGSGVAAA